MVRRITLHTPIERTPTALGGGQAVAGMLGHVPRLEVLDLRYLVSESRGWCR